MYVIKKAAQGLIKKGVEISEDPYDLKNQEKLMTELLRQNMNQLKKFDRALYTVSLKLLKPALASAVTISPAVPSSFPIVFSSIMWMLYARSY